MVACLSRAVLAWPRRLAEAALYEGGELEAIAGNAMEMYQFWVQKPA